MLIQGGKITAVGSEAAMTMPAGIKTIDAAGKWVTPGIIDIHSHLGVYPSPGIEAHQDGNESLGPVTAEVWVEHSIWPHDPGLHARHGRRRHGDADPARLGQPVRRPRRDHQERARRRTAQDMKFPGAPYTLKMACGENPKRVYGYGSGRFPGGAPFSRMGNVAGYREAWQKATEYKRKWDKYDTDFDAWEKKAKSPAPADWREEGSPSDAPTAPDRNLELDTLMGVLNGEILVQQHCYRADEMAQIIDLSKEFGYKVSAFHHGVEAYKIADLLAANGICGALWADWWGFKAEAYDGIRENIPMVHNAAAAAPSSTPTTPTASSA